jgi:hypothetical protein
MNSITQKIQETIKTEDVRNAGDMQFIALQQFIQDLKELGMDKKPEYTFPLTDTIGKTYYSSLNRHLKS